VDLAAPTTTVLEYCRSPFRRCGTKEGCAEGRLRRLHRVVGELAGEDSDFRAVNACIQFATTLDGKALFTVESLPRVVPDGTLHPGAAAMVELSWVRSVA